ncbi:Methylase involved in ubiquinone/menaquinone biosynthesis [Frankia canadensis]|uniref:Methylase involved in ubiquinone/menaquinone biosynthesis n=2 Tax=Frankia canadensis TaxID=1836972 RepID=A0A2I2KKA1_9ACTN|nr:Methylase involved in ubiquinone/menaquinone biosynthesis [Frankia canadensis]SOU53380.1 Methylase involved in ubiquinone/menaquinone biosynthesis [Frankia canadensis]
MGMTTDPREPVPGDAFGAVLRRCWASGARPGTVFAVLERDDGRVDVEDAARYFAGPDGWIPTERWACAQAVGRVLDVGCGAGRHLLALSGAGHDAVGLEPSAGAAAIARERGGEVVQATVTQPGIGLGAFDTIMMLGNNLGLLGSRERAPEVLASLAALAAPWARLLGCGMDPYRTADDGHLAYHAWNIERGRLPGQATLRVRDGAMATEWFDYLFLSPDELARLLEDSPWSLSGVEWEGASYVAVLDHAA